MRIVSNQYTRQLKQEVSSLKMVNATTIKPTKNWQCYDQTMPKEKIEKKKYIEMNFYLKTLFHIHKSSTSPTYKLRDNHYTSFFLPRAWDCLFFIGKFKYKNLNI